MDKKIEELIKALDYQIILTVNNNLAGIYLDAITALQSQAQEIERLRNPWVPIADIPEGMKSARTVDLICQTDSGLHRISDCLWHEAGGYWAVMEKSGNHRKIFEDDENPIVKITHAMLPPTPPKDT